MEERHVGGRAAAGFVLVVASCAVAPRRAQDPPRPPPPTPVVDGTVQEQTAPQQEQQEAPQPQEEAPAQDEPAETPALTGVVPEDTRDERNWIHGTSQTRFVQRWAGAERDADVYEVLSLEFGDERYDAWTGHAAARLAWDIDGKSQSTFFSLADSEEGDPDVQLYDAYAQTRNRGALDLIRLGRQFAYDTPIALWFDGVWAQTKGAGKSDWSTGVYGGVPVHAYEASSNGDWLAGIFEEVRPTRALRVRADYLHVADETVSADHENDLLGAGLFHDAGERLRWEAHYSALDGENRDLALNASWLDSAHDFTLQANFYRLLEPQRSLALELDPFFDTLMTLEPYDETRVSASKGFGEHFQALAGVDFRRVLDASDVGPFNHDFDRVFATLTFAALPADLTLALTGESWNDSDSDFRTWGADLSRAFGHSVEANIGSFYSLFKFDPFGGSETDDVRTYYALVRWHVTNDHTLQLRYEHEEQDIDDFDSLRWGWLWRF